MRGRWLVSLVSTVALLCFVSCSVPYWDRRSSPRFADIDTAATVIKLHTQNGEVYILPSWRLSAEGRAIVGKGERLSPSRQLLQRGAFKIPLPAVAQFESNRRKEHTSTGVSAMRTVASLCAILTIAAVAAFIDPLTDDDGRY